jgi:type II secretory pathway predicted ATPase ExeA
MLTDVMAHFGFTKSLRQAGYFVTDHHQQLLKDLQAAIWEGGLVAMTAVVGSGKTMLLWQLQDVLQREGEIEVAESLAFDVPRVNLGTLKLALFYDLATDKDGDLPAKPEKSERALMKLIRRCDKPIALCVDDAHDLHGHTLRGLKQLIEKTRRRGGRLAVVLAGHPKLKNELRRPALEEIGARATIFELEGIKGHQRRYLTWLLTQCHTQGQPTDILTNDALELLAERLSTPLQIEHYLTLALEHAYQLGETCVTPEIVAMTLAPDLHALEPTLARYGYNVSTLSEVLHIRQTEVRLFLQGQLPPGRAEELHTQLLRAGIPLSDNLAPVGSSSATA